METRLNWLVFGAGAIGTYIGVSLILHGQNVVFLEQPTAVATLKEQGLRFNFQGQENRLLHPDVYASLPEVLSLAKFDVGVFTLKSFDTQSALEGMQPYKASLPPILCLQNGVENEVALRQILGREKVIAGTVTSSVSRRGIGDVVLERQRGIGIASDHPLSIRIHRAFVDASFNTRLFSSPLAMKWSKMLTNLLANATCAILDMTPAAVLSHAGLYRLEVAQVREALAVMQGLHLRPIDLPGTPVVAFSSLISYLPNSISQPLISNFAGRGRGQKMPSFHIDLHSGRSKNEVEFLNGAVVRFGDSLHIPTPVNQWLNHTLMSIVRGSQPIDEYAHKPIKLIQDLQTNLDQFKQ
jgi:2-dehydropantoate 2-reductase